MRGQKTEWQRLRHIFIGPIESVLFSKAAFISHIHVRWEHVPSVQYLAIRSRDAEGCDLIWSKSKRGCIVNILPKQRVELVCIKSAKS